MAYILTSRELYIEVHKNVKKGNWYSGFPSDHV